MPPQTPRATFMQGNSAFTTVPALGAEGRAITDLGLTAYRRGLIARNQLSWPMALSSISPATSTADGDSSGITHFTLPALISSCAMRQGLRECVSITGGAPL